MNYTAKLDISKITGAFACKIQGQNTTKNCICIPTDAAGVFVGQKGIYIDLRIVELSEDRRRFEDTHIIRQSFPKDLYETLSEEDKRNIPPLGGMKPINITVTQIQPATKEASDDKQYQAKEDSNLPF